MFELSQMGKEAGIPEENFIGMNKGSQTNFDGLKIGMTAAVHSGNEAGFVVTGDEKTIYHAGDTALFSDMKLIGELYRPDVALLPIGGFFTMSPKEAKVAAEMIGARITIPMHFNTFPPIKQDPMAFKNMVTKNTEVKVLKVGEEFTL
jgi:L-ascorbate metabolism protein UlaG (beta-lactamase superfamily)